MCASFYLDSDSGANIVLFGAESFETSALCIPATKIRKLIATKEQSECVYSIFALVEMVKAKKAFRY
jgi:hypothetical protein